jgi:TRAP-type C4-dicarboxylate transport system substrate-binding protein
MTFRTLLLGAALAALAVPAAAQDKPFNLKLSHWVPATHPLQKAMEEWGASVEKASNGTIKSTVYPAQQLGKAPDHYDMTRDGIVDFAYINPGYQPGRFPIVSAGELPFLVGEAHGGIRAVDAWYRKYAASEMKGVKLCFSFILDPLRMHSRNKKVVVPGDIKGMKIRPAQATMAAWVTQLGGTNVTSSPSEIREILDKGVADATTTPYGSVLLFGIDKVTKYHLDLPLATTTFQWIMNPSVYEAMSASQKKVIDDHCTNDWAARFAGPWADFEAAGINKLRELPGHEIVSVTPDQLKEWKASGEPVYKSWADGVRKAGGDPDVVLKELQAALAQYKASF